MAKGQSNAMADCHNIIWQEIIFLGTDHKNKYVRVLV
jgi:hypothetical protein